jgi:hypothetical protein
MTGHILIPPAARNHRGFRNVTVLAIITTVTAAFTSARIVVVTLSSLHVKADLGRGLSCELVDECVHCVAPG